MIGRCTLGLGLTLLALPALAADVCAPLRGTDQYSPCLIDQMTRQGQDLARSADPDRALDPLLPPVPYRIGPPYPPLGPHQDGFLAQQDQILRNTQKSLQNRTLMLQQEVRRALPSPPPLGSLGSPGRLP
jgi:hypothetical protein